MACLRIYALLQHQAHVCRTLPQSQNKTTRLQLTIRETARQNRQYPIFSLGVGRERIRSREGIQTDDEHSEHKQDPAHELSRSFFFSCRGPRLPVLRSGRGVYTAAKRDLPAYTEAGEGKEAGVEGDPPGAATTDPTGGPVKRREAKPVGGARVWGRVRSRLGLGTRPGFRAGNRASPSCQPAGPEERCGRSDCTLAASPRIALVTPTAVDGGDLFRCAMCSTDGT
jgi:hypothetical protein